MSLLIVEDNFDNVKYNVINESSGKKNYYIDGVFLQAEQKNRNGRIYPTSILEKEVNRFTKDYINNNRALGELCHPQSPSVNPERACHLIESLNKSGNNWIGRSKVTNTPMGNIVKGLMEDGVQLGVSSRGLGTLSENSDGVKVVNEDYYMSTIDVVSDPSAPDAWVNGIYEGKEFYVAGQEQFIEKVKNHIDKEFSHKKFSKLDELFLFNTFSNFLNILGEEKVRIDFKKGIKKYKKELPNNPYLDEFIKELGLEDLDEDINPDSSKARMLVRFWNGVLKDWVEFKHHKTTSKRRTVLAVKMFSKMVFVAFILGLVVDEIEHLASEDKEDIDFDKVDKEVAKVDSYINKIK